MTATMWTWAMMMMTLAVLAASMAAWPPTRLADDGDGGGGSGEDEGSGEGEGSSESEKCGENAEMRTMGRGCWVPGCFTPPYYRNVTCSSAAATTVKRCVCRDGYLMNENTRRCVPASQCSPKRTAVYARQTTACTHGALVANDMYCTQPSCNGERSVKCPADGIATLAALQCLCADGYLVDDNGDGSCVREANCNAAHKASDEDLRMCGGDEHMAYRTWTHRRRTCAIPALQNRFVRKLHPSCHCQNGRVVEWDGRGVPRCVLPHECNKVPYAQAYELLDAPGSPYGWRASNIANLTLSLEENFDYYQRQSL